MGDDDQQRKRRKLATLATALVAKYVSNESNESSSTGRDCPQFKGRKTGSPTVRRFRSNDSHMFLSDMSDRLFRRRYRMKKASFFQQLEQLRLHLPLSANPSISSPLPLRLKSLLIFLISSFLVCRISATFAAVIVKSLM
jgi:hypothetical protein